MFVAALLAPLVPDGQSVVLNPRPAPTVYARTRAGLRLSRSSNLRNVRSIHPTSMTAEPMSTEPASRSPRAVAAAPLGNTHRK